VSGITSISSASVSASVKAVTRSAGMGASAGSITVQRPSSRRERITRPPRMRRTSPTSPRPAGRKRWRTGWPGFSVRRPRPPRNQSAASAPSTTYSTTTERQRIAVSAPPPAVDETEPDHQEGERLGYHRAPEDRVALLGRDVELLHPELLVAWAMGDRRR